MSKQRLFLPAAGQEMGGVLRKSGKALCRTELSQQNLCSPKASLGWDDCAPFEMFARCPTLPSQAKHRRGIALPSHSPCCTRLCGVTAVASPPTVPACVYYQQLPPMRVRREGWRTSPASALLASPLSVLPCCRHAVCHRLVTGRWGLWVGPIFILKSEAHLCIRRWRSTRGLLLSVTGLLVSSKTLFVSWRVKTWSGGQNATNICVLFK